MTDSCLSGSFSNDTIHLKQQLVGTEHSHFTFDLSNENLNGKMDSHSESLGNLNRTFCVGLDNNSLNESYDSPLSETILYSKINHSTLESVCSTKKSACVQLDLEKLEVLDKTINLTTCQPNGMPEKNRFSRLDSEESLGIIPEVLESSCELLDSSPMLNDKKNYAEEVINTEVFFSWNQICRDLNKRCLIDFNTPLNSCANSVRCTSTPKQLNNYIDLNSPLMFTQYEHFLLQEGEKVDEPTIAGSTHQTATQMCFDEMEFDRGKILTSTSKLSSLQIHSPDLLSKTSVLNFQSHEIGVFNNENQNTQSTSKDAAKVNDCENSETKALLHDTFEVKPAPRYSLGILDRNCLGASANSPQICTTINKTISIENTTVIPKKSIKAPTTSLPKPMKTNVYGKIQRSVNACKNSIGIPLKVKAVPPKTMKSNETFKKVSSRTKATVKTSLNDTFSKNKVYKGNVKSTCEFLNSNSGASNSNKNLTFCLSESHDETNARNHEKFETSADLICNSDKLQIELHVTSVTETDNEESLNQNVTFNDKNDTKTLTDDCFVGNDISKQCSFKNEKISYNKGLNSYSQGKQSDDKNRTFSANEMEEVRNSETTDEIFNNNHNVEIEELSTDDCDMKINDEEWVKNGEVQALSVINNVITEHLTSQEDGIKSNDTCLNPHFKLNSSEKESNQTIHLGKEIVTINKNDTFEVPCKISSKNTYHNNEMFEAPGEIFSKSCKLQTELSATSVTETANKESLKQEVTFNDKNYTNTSTDDCFVGNGISKQISLKNEKINYNTGLNSYSQGKQSEDKNRTFSANDTVEVQNSEMKDEIFSNNHNVEIKELSTDDCEPKINKEKWLKNGEAQALSVIKNVITEHISSQEDRIKLGDAGLNPHFKLNSSEKESNQTIHCEKDVTINKNDTFEIQCKISTKSTYHNDEKYEICSNSHKLQTELPATSVTETANDNLKQEVTFKSSKNISENSNMEYKNKSSVSLKGLVKGLFF